MLASRLTRRAKEFSPFSRSVLFADYERPRRVTDRGKPLTEPWGQPPGWSLDWHKLWAINCNERSKDQSTVLRRVGFNFHVHCFDSQIKAPRQQTTFSRASLPHTSRGMTAISKLSRHKNERRDHEKQKRYLTDIRETEMVMYCWDSPEELNYDFHKVSKIISWLWQPYSSDGAPA